MKNLLVGLTIALLAAGTALGATMTVKGPASVDPGQEFMIVVALDADGQDTIGWAIEAINATGGATPGPNTGNDADYYLAGAGYDNGAVGSNPIMTWASQTAFPVGQMGTVPSGDFGGSGDIFQMPVIAPMPPDSFFDVFVVNGAYGSAETYDDMPCQSVPLTVYVTPEPVSALLLLAGLPMLRRRR